MTRPKQIPPGSPEDRVSLALHRRLDPATERLWRVVPALAYVASPEQTAHHRDNDGNHVVILKNPRRIQTAPPGWPDWTGLRAREITDADVGKIVGQFYGVEIKAGRDRMRPEQAKLGDIIRALGGIYEVVGEEIIDG